MLILCTNALQDLLELGAPREVGEREPPVQEGLEQLVRAVGIRRVIVVSVGPQPELVHEVLHPLPPQGGAPGLGYVIVARGAVAGQQEQLVPHLLGPHPPLPGVGRGPVHDLPGLQGVAGLVLLPHGLRVVVVGHQIGVVVPRLQHTTIRSDPSTHTHSHTRTSVNLPSWCSQALIMAWECCRWARKDPRCKLVIRLFPAGINEFSSGCLSTAPGVVKVATPSS